MAWGSRMSNLEYKLVQATDDTLRANRRHQDRFAALEGMINEYAAQGWEFLRLEAVNLRKRRFLLPDNVERRLIAVFTRNLGEPERLQGRPPPLELTNMIVPGRPAPSRTLGHAKLKGVAADLPAPAKRVDPERTPTIETAVAGVRAFQMRGRPRSTGLHAISNGFAPLSAKD